MMWLLNMYKHISMLMNNWLLPETRLTMMQGCWASGGLISAM